MANGSDAILHQVIEAIAKDLFTVEIYTNATGWLQVEKHLNLGDNRVACFVPSSDDQRRVYVLLEEIKAARVTKAGDALALGHDS